MNRIPARQQGQALVEALLMLPLLALLLWAASWIGGLQFTAQEMAQASRKTAMAGALGQPMRNSSVSGGMTLSDKASTLSGIAPAQVNALQDEWFGVDLKLLSVTASAARFDRDRAAWLRIARRTHVASGAGYAHGDADTQRRIGRAPTSWYRAERTSLAEARRLKPIVDRLDGPWRRPGLSLDWLSEWADVVPQERFVRRKGAGK
jgi:hypothetical protein